ncbi:MAG TPA: hypothetical protein VF199_00120 [Bacillales bacterium]
MRAMKVIGSITLVIFVDVWNRFQWFCQEAQPNREAACKPRANFTEPNIISKGL